MQETRFRPLYQQVYDTLTARIASGYWQPGEKIPSEFALADELKVSQGTVRKALNAMSADCILSRHQGRGTFVPEQTIERTLSHFFRIRKSDGAKVVPKLLNQTLSRLPGTDASATQFNCPDPGDLWLIERTRLVDTDIPVLDRILVRSDLIAGLDQADPLPVSFYAYYQKAHGITITRVEDRLHADTARRFHLRRIDLPAGTPLIVVERLSYDLRDRIVEFRTTYFPTEKLNYAVSHK